MNGFALVLFTFSLSLFFAFTGAVSQDNLDRFSPGALTTGLGRSGIVENYDPSSLYWNPAGLAVTHYPQGAISIHEPHHVNFLGYSHFTPKYGSFGFAYGSTSATKDAVQLSSIGWAYQIAPGFYGGLSAGRVQHVDMAWGTLGVGLLYKPASSIHRPVRSGKLLRSPFVMDRLAVGLTIQNLPLGMSEFDHQIRIGASYKFMQSGPTLVYSHHFMPSRDSDHVGLLITPISSLQVYAGFKDFDTNTFSFGAGYSWQNLHVQLAYDRTSKRLLFSTTVRIGQQPGAIAGSFYDRAVDAVKQKDKRTAMKYCQYSLIYDENYRKSADLQRLLIPIIAQENVTIDSLLHVALSFQNQQRFLDAAAQYLKILKIDSKNAEAVEAIAMIRPKVNIDAERWYVQAVDFYENGDIVRAGEIFESIILVRPDHFGSKNYIKKINLYNVKQAEQHYFAGLGYYSQHKLDQADAEFRKALNIAPQYEDASNYLARISQARAQNKNRIAELEQQAEEKESQRAWKSAQSLYEEILRIQPDHSNSLSKIADLKKKLADSADLSFGRGLSAYNAGDITTAEQHFRTALSMNASHANARRYLRKIASSTTDKAAIFIEQAQKSLDQKDWQNAVTLADSALFADPNSKQASSIKASASNKIKVRELLVAARNFYASGQYLEAMQALDQILKTESDNAVARELMQECQEKLNNRVDDYFSRGIELYTEERYQEAITMWDIVLRINPYHKGALDYHKRAQERIKALDSLP